MSTIGFRMTMLCLLVGLFGLSDGKLLVKNRGEVLRSYDRSQYDGRQSYQADADQSYRQAQECQNTWWDCLNARGEKLRRICVKYQLVASGCEPDMNKDQIVERCQKLEAFTDDAAPTPEPCGGRRPKH